MSFRNLVRDLRDSIGSLSRRSFEVRLSGHHRDKSLSSVNKLHDSTPVVQPSCWSNLPPELLYDVIKRLEDDENAWPSRKSVVACAAVCKTWRDMCIELVKSPEFSGKLTFPVSLKQPGPRDGTIQCFIKRDKSKMTYHLYLSLNPTSVLSENGKFLLSAKRTRRTTYTEYIISIDPGNISRSSNTYIGKLRSNFLGTKFIVLDTQLPYNSAALGHSGKRSRRFNSKKVSPKIPMGSYNIAQVTYELSVLGTRGPRRMHVVMDSIPASSLDIGGTVPGLPQNIIPHNLEASFGSSSFSRSSIFDHSMDFNSGKFSDIGSSGILGNEESGRKLQQPLVLRNKPPRWHEQLQCWCLNFRGRVTVASVKNFQLIAATQQQQQEAAAAPPQPPAPQSDHNKIILQFGKVAMDTFTMDYRYPLSVFQAFAICLSSFDQASL